MQPLGIYVHIPYCLQKCLYCDFASEPVSCAKIDPDVYADAVCREIETCAAELAAGRLCSANADPGINLCGTDLKESEGNKFPADTIFFGGGTPTCLGTDQIGRILLDLKRCFDVAEDAEISIEANPETVTLKKAQNLKSLGFNRVSMGVQSLDDGVIKALGRVHSADTARRAFYYLRDAGFDNINLDLMLGVPGQTEKIWNETLREVLKMAPEHISFYSLQIEEGTPFYNAYKNGEMDIPDWNENRRMYHRAVSMLKDHGYLHYEVSNAAKPGRECRHNLKYWTMQPYLGFGAAAHSFFGGRRFSNPEDTAEYTGRVEDHSGPVFENENDRDIETDWIFTGLRLIGGTDFGSDICFKYALVIDELSREGYIIKDGTRLRLSVKGLDNTNYVMGRFING